VLTSTEVSVDLRTIPTTIDRTTYEQRFAALLPGTALWTGRLFAALACARTAGSSSWAHAAHSIGIPADVGARLSNTVTQRVTDPPGLAAAVCSTLDEIWNANIDYVQRRAHMSKVTALPAELLRTILIGRPITTARTIHAAAWLWENYTSSPASWSPAHDAASINGSRRETLRETYRVFSHGLTPDQQRSLAALAPDVAGPA
jgi:hypothetical protein